jgi:WD40 repeat protein
VLATLHKQSERVNCILVTSDSQTAVFCSDDGTSKICDLKAAAVSQTLTGHTRGVNSLCLDAEDRLLISGSSDHTLVIWDLKSHAKIHTLTGHAAKVRAVSLSADGKYAISSSSDGIVIVWNLEPRVDTCLLGSNTHSPIKSIAMVKGRPYMALLGSDEGTLTIWDIKIAERIWHWQGHTKRVDSVAAIGSDLVLSVSSDGTAKVWQLPQAIQETPELIAEFVAGGPLYACAVSRDEKTIAVGEASGAVHFLHLHRG